jgi:hypothetical protein
MEATMAEFVTEIYASRTETVPRARITGHCFKLSKRSVLAHGTSMPCCYSHEWGMAPRLFNGLSKARVEAATPKRFGRCLIESIEPNARIHEIDPRIHRTEP